MKIQFYILNTSEADKITHFTCQLIEKIFNKNHRIQLQLSSESQIKQYDDALWAYKMSESFLAHLPESETNNTENKVPIVLSHNAGFIMAQPDILISLDVTYLPNEQFKQVLFIVDANKHTVEQARKRYQHFKMGNHQLITHKIDIN